MLHAYGELHFTVECHLYRRPNFRDDNLEMESYMGRGVLEAIFDRMEQQPKVTSLFLSFPERWLNIVEQRQLYARLNTYCPNLKTLKLKTHSAFIVQCTPATSLFMTDDIPEDVDQGDVTIKQYVNNRGNLINMNQLTVLQTK